MSITFRPTFKGDSHELAGHSRMVDIATELALYQFREALRAVDKEKDKTLGGLIKHTDVEPESYSYDLDGGRTKIRFSVCSAKGKT